MQELSPEEFAYHIDENGKFSPKNLSEKDLESLFFVKAMQHSTQEAGYRCPSCKGTCFTPNTNLTCSMCNGRGWR